MLASEYFKLLDLPGKSSIEEIKKAYRKKARIFHPDVNHSPDAKDKFISITEAYEFLITNHSEIMSEDLDFFKVVEEWQKYRQERARKRAQYYARTSYSKFTNTKFYKSTRILNGSVIVFNFTISILVLIYTVLGYIIRLRTPSPYLEKPSIFSFILLLLLSTILFTVSFIYLKAYLEINKKRRKKS